MTNEQLYYGNNTNNRNVTNVAVNFSEWCYDNFTSSATKKRENQTLYYAYLGKATELFGQGYYTMIELYQIWENLEIDKTLAIDKLDEKTNMD